MCSVWYQTGIQTMIGTSAKGYEATSMAVSMGLYDRELEKRSSDSLIFEVSQESIFFIV